MNLLVAGSAAYLTYAATTYLDLKSGLPFLLCLAGGLALAAPMLLVARRPMVAWSPAWAAALVTGHAVQDHARTPFSWHPAVLAAHAVILVMVVLRAGPQAVAWTAASMIGLITVSFYPADRLSLMILFGLVMGVAGVVRFGRMRRSRAKRGAAPVGPGVYPALPSS